MQGMPAIYCGRLVSKENFRVFIYNTNLEKKLIESWDAFVAHMETGVWFSTERDALCARQPSGELKKENLPEVKKKSSKVKN